MIYLYIWLAFVFLNLGIGKFKKLDTLIDGRLRDNYPMYSEDEWTIMRNIATFIFCLWGPLITFVLLTINANDDL